MSNTRMRVMRLILAGLSCALVAQCSEDDPGPALLAAEQLDGEGGATREQAATTGDPQPSEVGTRSEEEVGGSIRLLDLESDQFLGTAREGELLTTSFEFVSDGPGALVIEAIDTSCGCTVPGIWLYGDGGEKTRYELDSPIPAGTRFRLSVDLSTRRKVGTLHSSISIVSNDPTRVFVVRTEVEVEPLLDYDPDFRVAVGPMGPDDQEHRVVTITSRRKELFSLFEPGAPAGVQLKLVPFEPDAEGLSNRWDVEVTAGPGLPEGDVNYSIWIKTDLRIPNPKMTRNDPSPEYHTAMIAVQKQGMVFSQPSFLSFGSVRPGEVAERTARIECRDDFSLDTRAPITIEGNDGSVHEFAANITAVLGPSDDGRGLELRVALEAPPLEAAGSLQGAVRIRVGHPDQDEVLVRFGASVPARSTEDRVAK